MTAPMTARWPPWSYQTDSLTPCSSQDSAAHDGALASMELWYAHALTTVCMLTAPTKYSKSLPASERLTYSDRGWPTFEHATASLCKMNSADRYGHYLLSTIELIGISFHFTTTLNMEYIAH